MAATSGVPIFRTDRPISPAALVASSAWPSEKCAARGLRCSSSPWTTTAGPSGDRFVVVLDIVLLHGKPKGAVGPLQANGRGSLCRRNAGGGIVARLLVLAAEP